MDGLPYYRELESIREYLSRHTYWGRKRKQFPKLKCEITSLIVKELLGLEIAAGDVDKVDDIYHLRNYDPKRKIYIDLTMDQFGKSYPPIVVESMAEARGFNQHREPMQSIEIDNARFFFKRELEQRVNDYISWRQQ